MFKKVIIKVIMSVFPLFIVLGIWAGIGIGNENKDSPSYPSEEGYYFVKYNKDIIVVHVSFPYFKGKRLYAWIGSDAIGTDKDFKPEDFLEKIEFGKRAKCNSTSAGQPSEKERSRLDNARGKALKK